jgi:hypothetical protein
MVGSPENFMVAEQGIDLVQDAATDCSVVASLTAVHARKDRGFEKVSLLVRFKVSILILPATVRFNSSLQRC